MIPIVKGSEPNQLLTYRLNKNISPTYDNMKGAKISQFIKDGSDENLYEIVLEALAKEQGYICAYCMRSIPQRKEMPRMTIEHIITQHESTEDSLKYSNMLAVCNGNRNKANNYKTCDAKRGSMPLSEQTLILNPLNPDSLKNLYYEENGKLCSSIKKEQDFIDDVLNLNSSLSLLPECRKQALSEFQCLLGQEFKGKTLTKADFQAQYDKYSNAPKKLPYVGIILNWLQKKMK